ncbi:hypothetical protein J2847_003964 [Azospirillum agricola]|uniref:DUF6232 family protein n=1 Tax=Azospirillum agricola TaxID=1720247 RepID=UPI001AEAE07B|nr:DUF6232 family protein [Azospirillum agricola]MBP2230659.1 hypothetical protein [Azospirillum agricola]
MENPIYIDADVTIAPSYAVIAGATYPIDTIHSVRLEKVSGRIGAGPVALAVVGACVALLSLGGFRNGDTAAATVVLTIGLALFALGVRELRRGGKYALIVSTSSGQQRILQGRRYDQLEMIRHVLGNAIISAREATLVQKLSDDGTKPCPLCAETIKANAVVCRFCGHDLAAVAAVPSVPVAGPQAEPDVADRLRDLKTLHDKALISEAEYEEHRRALLAASFKVPT